MRSNCIDKSFIDTLNWMHFSVGQKASRLINSKVLNLKSRLLAKLDSESSLLSLYLFTSYWEFESQLV